MLRWRTVHLLIGTAGLIAFLLTGQYMRWVHNGLQGMSDGPRLFLRSAHIYLLWSSLLNVVLGCYLIRLQPGWLRHTQSFASLAIAVGPLLLCTSFFLEPHNSNLLRPIGQLAIFLAFGAVLVHAIITVVSRASSET